MSLVYDKMEEAVSMIEEFYDNYSAIFKTVNYLRVKPTFTREWSYFYHGNAYT